MLPKIINAIREENFTLKIQFEDKVWRRFSVVPYLDYLVFQPLKNNDFFKKAKVKYKTIVWGQDEEIDFDPFTLWSENVEIQL